MYFQNVDFLFIRGNMERVITYQALLLMSQDETITIELRENYERVLKFLDDFFVNKEVMIEEINKCGLLRQLENGRVLYNETSPIVLNTNEIESIWKGH